MSWRSGCPWGTAGGLGDTRPADAGCVVSGCERVVPDHHVQAYHRFAVRAVDGEPGRVADDVESGVGRLPLLGEPGAQQSVDLDAAVEFLTEVLPTGVGDAQAERELQHGRRIGPVERTDGGGGVPGGAVRAEVTQKAGVEEGRGLGAVLEFARLPGVQGQRGVPVGQGQFRPGELEGELVCGSGRPRWVQAESIASTERFTAIQCTGKDPCNSGE